MANIFGPDGTTLLGDIPISPQEQSYLDAGATITLQFHTPLRHRERVGAQDQIIRIVKQLPSGNLVTDNPQGASAIIRVRAQIGTIEAMPSPVPVPVVA